jgi:hypothetical protein
MPKYVALWEVDLSRVSMDPDEVRATHVKSMEKVRQVLKDNPGSDFGIFIGESKGYFSGLKSWQEVVKLDQMFSPWVKFKVYQAYSAIEDEEVSKPV